MIEPCQRLLFASEHVTPRRRQPCVAQNLYGNARTEVVIYPGTPHAFHADYRPSYRKDKAEDGWKRATDWFKKYL